MGGFGGRRGKGVMIRSHYNWKRKKNSKPKHKISTVELAASQSFSGEGEE